MKMIEKKCESKCPKCDSGNIIWGGTDLQDETIIYEARCNDCGIVFSEEFKLTYNITTYEEKG